MTKSPIILLAVIPLAACVSFGAKPPPSLLTLTATAQVPVGQPQVAAASPATTQSTLSVAGEPVASVTNQPLVGGSASITILTPSVPQEIATQRVPVQVTPTSVAYVDNAQWVEPPAKLFARLLSDTVTARTGRVVLSTAQSFQAGGAQMTGELRQFGIDAATKTAVVVFDASLLRATGGGIEKQRFEAHVPVNAIDAADAGTGLNAAANQIAGQVADWVGRS